MQVAYTFKHNIYEKQRKHAYTYKIIFNKYKNLKTYYIILLLKYKTGLAGGHCPRLTTILYLRIPKPRFLY